MFFNVWLWRCWSSRSIKLKTRWWLWSRSLVEAAFHYRCWHRQSNNPDNPDRPNLFALFWSQILQREDAEREDFGKQNLQFYCMPYSEFCIVCQEQKILVWLGRSTRRSWDVWLRFRAEALWDVFWFLIPISHKYWRYLYKWIYFTPQACWSVELGIETLVSLLDSSDSDDSNHYPLLAWGRIAHFSSKEELKHSRKKRESVFLGWTCPTSFYCFPSQSLDSWLVSSPCWSFGSRPTHQWIGAAGRGLTKIIDSGGFYFSLF